MLVIDMSQSMRATDVEPNRLKAAEQAASQFASQLTPGVNL
jgi:Ca-activated chloride channel family protein